MELPSCSSLCAPEGVFEFCFVKTQIFTRINPALHTDAAPQRSLLSQRRAEEAPIPARMRRWPRGHELRASPLSFRISREEKPSTARPRAATGRDVVRPPRGGTPRFAIGQRQPAYRSVLQSGGAEEPLRSSRLRPLRHSARRRTALSSSPQRGERARGSRVRGARREGSALRPGGGGGAKMDAGFFRVSAGLGGRAERRGAANTAPAGNARCERSAAAAAALCLAQRSAVPPPPPCAGSCGTAAKKMAAGREGKGRRPRAAGGAAGAFSAAGPCGSGLCRRGRRAALRCGLSAGPAAGGAANGPFCGA